MSGGDSFDGKCQPAEGERMRGRLRLARVVVPVLLLPLVHVSVAAARVRHLSIAMLRANWSCQSATCLQQRLVRHRCPR